MDSYKIELDRFHRDIRKYIGDYNIYIIKPKSYDIEDYSMNLETTWYGISSISCSMDPLRTS